MSLLGWTLALGVAVTSAVAAEPVEPTAAEVRQEVVPSLRGRALAAEARVRDALGYFAGRMPVEEAFPDLAGGSLLDPGYLQAQTRALEVRAAARAAERVAPLPSVDPGLRRSLAAARSAAFDGEDRADALVLRLLAALSGGLDRAPQLADDALQPMLAELRDARAAWAADPDEASPEQAAAAVASAGAEAAIGRLRDAVVRRWSVPGDRSLAEVVASDLAPREPALAEKARVDRLRRVAPLLDGALADRVTAALAAAEADRVAGLERSLQRVQIQLAALRAGQVAVDGDLADLEAHAAEADRRVEQLRSDPPDAPVELELAEAEAALAGARIAAAREHAEQARLAEAQQSAEQHAEASRQAAHDVLGDGADGRLTAVKQQVSELHSTVAAMFDAEAARAKAASEQIEAARTALSQRTDAAASALALPPLDPGRRGAIDRAYLDLRASVDDLYAQLGVIRAQRRQWGQEARPRALDEPLEWTGTAAPSPELAGLAQAWRAAVEDHEGALRARQANSQAEIDQLNRLLDDALEQRRVLRGYASASARSDIGRRFFVELGYEVAGIPDQVTSGARTAAETLRGLPTRLLDLNALSALLVRSIVLVLVLVAWALVRGRSADVVGRITRLAGVRVPWIDSEHVAWQGQLAATLRHGLDLVAGLVLVDWLTPRAPVLGALALLWAARSVWRLVPPLVDVLVASPGAARPALLLASPAGRRLTARSLRGVVAWYAATWLADYVAIRLLDADRLADLLGWLADVAFWVIVARALWLWSPLAHRAIRRLDEQNGVTRWLGRDRTSEGWLRRLVDVPIVAIGVLYLTGVHVGRLLGRVIDQRAGLSWLRTAIARRQVRAADEDERLPLPPDLRAALQVADPVAVPRPAAEDRLREAHAAWLEEGRRGLVSLTGDRGSGKEQLLQGLDRVLGVDDVVHLRVLSRPDPEEPALAWLGRQLELPTSGPAWVLQALAERPPTVFAVHGAHLLVRRAVRGYAPLRSLIELMTSSCERHFWVLSLHGPMWDYLTGIGARLELDAFRDHVPLGPLAPESLADWLEGRAGERGLTCSYAPLAQGLGADPGLAERRARNAYWRLLADAVDGNPAAAAGLWLTSLESTPGSRLDVHLFRAPPADQLDPLDDDLLFVLAALVQHEQISAADLGEVLNRPAGAVRADGRQLEGLGVVRFEPEGATYRLTTRWRAPVHRLLRQKHFLHGV